MSTGTHQQENLYDMTPVRTNLAGVVASSDDLLLIEQLRCGNEAAFVSLVDRYHATMMRLAMVYVTAAVSLSPHYQTMTPMSLNLQ